MKNDNRKRGIEKYILFLLIVWEYVWFFEQTMVSMSYQLIVIAELLIGVLSSKNQADKKCVRMVLGIKLSLVVLLASKDDIF